MIDDKAQNAIRKAYERTILNEGNDNKNILKAIDDGMDAINQITKYVPMTQNDRKSIFSSAWIWLSKKRKEIEGG